jgi:TonB family protein
MSANDSSRRPQPAAPPLDGARGLLRPGALLARVLLAALALWLLGCGREQRTGAQALALSVRAGADTARMEHLQIRPPRPARAWLARVTPAPPGMTFAPLPDAAPDTLLPEPAAPPTLEVEPGLMPPVLRDAAPLTLPPGPAGRRARRFESVILDVRVSERGEVTDVLEAGGSPDSALAEAARACARRMRFYPARWRGEPVAVWCRQRFDFGPTGTPRP